MLASTSLALPLDPVCLLDFLSPAVSPGVSRVCLAPQPRSAIPRRSSGSRQWGSSGSPTADTWNRCK